MESLEEYYRELLHRCDKDMEREHYRKERRIADLFEEDRKSLLPLPSVAFDPSRYLTVRTNTYAKFSLHNGKHLYSTAPKYANSRVLVQVTAHEVIILNEPTRTAATVFGKQHSAERGNVLRTIAVLCEKSPFDDVVRAVTEALERGVRDTDSLIALHRRVTEELPQLEPVTLPDGIPALSEFRFDASQYDAMLNKGGKEVC